MLLQSLLSSLGGSEGLKTLAQTLAQALAAGAKSAAGTLPQRAKWLGAVPGASVFLAGAAVGAGAALMLAPMSGAEMRKKLKERLERMRAEVEAGAQQRAADKAASDVRVTEVVPVGAQPAEQRSVPLLDQERREPGQAPLSS